MIVNQEVSNSFLLHSRGTDRLSYQQDHLNQDRKLHFLSVQDVKMGHSFNSVFNFQLTEMQTIQGRKPIYGLQIFMDDQKRRLIVEPRNQKVEAHESLQVNWELYQPQDPLTNPNSLWILKKTEENEKNWFHIELTYGETRPRLISCEAFKNILFRASMDEVDGYSNRKFNSWHISCQS